MRERMISPIAAKVLIKRRSCQQEADDAAFFINFPCQVSKSSLSTTSRNY
jgi:hypothetical protein